MHAIRKYFILSPCKALCWRAAAFTRVESRVNLHLKSAAEQRTKLEVKPFWKIKAVLNNVSLALTCNVDEDFFVDLQQTPHQPHNGLDIKYDSHSQVAKMTFSGDSQSALSLSLPFQVDFDIVLGGSGSASIGGVENESIQINAENYDVELGDLKSNSINVVSDKGNIQCLKTLRGNINLVSHDGNISTRKIQGHNVSISCAVGCAKAGDVYAEKLLINAEEEIQVKSIHGASQLHSKGGIVVGTAEGDISMVSQRGDIDLYLADHARNVDVTAESGNVRLAFSPDMNEEVNVDARTVDDSDSELTQIFEKIDENCSKYQCGDGSGLTAVTVKTPNGTTFLRRRSWLEAVSAFNRESRERH